MLLPSLSFSAQWVLVTLLIRHTVASSLAFTEKKTHGRGLFVGNETKQVPCPSNNRRNFSDFVYLDLSVNVTDLSPQDFLQMEQDCRTEYNDYILSACLPDDAYFQVTTCTASLIFDESLVEDADSNDPVVITSNDRMILQLDGFAYTQDSNQSPFAPSDVRRRHLMWASETAPLTLDKRKQSLCERNNKNNNGQDRSLSVLSIPTDGCYCYVDANADDGDSLPTLEQFAGFVNATGTVEGGLEVAQQQTCNETFVFDEFIEIIVEGDLSTGTTRRLFEKTLQDIFNDLSVELCVESHLFVYNVALQGSLDGVIDTFLVQYIAYQEDAPLFGDFTTVPSASPSVSLYPSESPTGSPAPSVSLEPTKTRRRHLMRETEEQTLSPAPSASLQPSASSLPSATSPPTISREPSPPSLQPSASSLPSATSPPSSSEEPSVPSASLQPSASGLPSTTSPPAISNEPSAPSASLQPSSSSLPSATSPPAISREPSAPSASLQPSSSSLPSATSPPSSSETPSASLQPSSSSLPSATSPPSISKAPSPPTPTLAPTGLSGPTTAPTPLAFPEVGDDPCYCEIGVRPIPVLPLTAINQRLAQGLRDGAVPGVTVARILGSGEPIYEKRQCNVSDTDFSSYVSIELSGSVANLTTEQKEDLSAILFAAYSNTTIQSCDQPFFRNMVDIPKIINVQNATTTDVASLFFELNMASRGAPDPLLAMELDPADNQSMPVRTLGGMDSFDIADSSWEHNIRFLQDSQVEGYCTLPEIFAGPTQEACEAGNATEQECECESNGCYCPPNALSTGPATSNEVLTGFNALLDPSATNNTGRRNLEEVPDIVDIVGLEQLGLGLNLAEFSEQNCSNYTVIQVYVILYLNVDPATLTAEQRQILADKTAQIINEYNTGVCEQTFTQILSTRVVDSLPTSLPQAQLQQSRRLFAFPLVVAADLGTTNVRTSGGGVNPGRRLFEDNLFEEKSPATRPKSGRSLLSFEEEGSDEFRCFCPANIETPGNAITATLFLTFLNEDLDEGLLGANETDVEAEEIITLIPFECESPLEAANSTVFLELILPFSNLTEAEIAQLEEDCVISYNFLASDVCDPDFTQMVSCFAEEYYGEEISSLNNSDLVGGVNRQTLLTLVATTLDPSAPFFENETSVVGNETNGNETNGERRWMLDDQDGARIAPEFAFNRGSRNFPRRGLQAVDNSTNSSVCYQNTECLADDDGDARRLVVQQKVNFDEFVSLINTTERIETAEEVVEQNCSDRAIYTYEYAVFLQGTLNNTREFEVLSLDTWNNLSVSQCDPRFIFVLDIVFTPDEEPEGERELENDNFFESPRRLNFPTVGAVTATYVCNGGSSQCSGSIFAENVGRRLFSSAGGIRLAPTGEGGPISLDEVPFSPNLRSLQEAEAVQGTCFCSVNSDGFNPITTQDFNAETNRRIQNGALPGVTAAVSVDEECRCELPGEGIYPPEEPTKAPKSTKAPASFSSSKLTKASFKSSKFTKAPHPDIVTTKKILKQELQETHGRTDHQKLVREKLMLKASKSSEEPKSYKSTKAPFAGKSTKAPFAGKSTKAPFTDKSLKSSGKSSRSASSKSSKADKSTKAPITKSTKAPFTGKSKKSKSTKAPSAGTCYPEPDADGFVRIDGIKVLPFGESPCTCEDLKEDGIISASSSGKKSSKSCDNPVCIGNRPGTGKGGKGSKSGKKSKSSGPDIVTFVCPPVVVG